MLERNKLDVEHLLIQRNDGSRMRERSSGSCSGSSSSSNSGSGSGGGGRWRRRHPCVAVLLLFSLFPIHLIKRKACVSFTLFSLRRERKNALSCFFSPAYFVALRAWKSLLGFFEPHEARARVAFCKMMDSERPFFFERCVFV